MYGIPEPVVYLATVLLSEAAILIVFLKLVVGLVASLPGLRDAHRSASAKIPKAVPKSPWSWLAMGGLLIVLSLVRVLLGQFVAEAWGSVDWIRTVLSFPRILVLLGGYGVWRGGVLAQSQRTGTRRD